MEINSSKQRRFVRRGAEPDAAVRNTHFGRVGLGADRGDGDE